MTRRCPKCGAVLPPESLNCPNCYTEVPREDVPAGTSGNYGNRKGDGEPARDRNRTICIILSIIPAFIGLLGLAQIYLDHRNPRGWHMLCLGFVTYVILVALILSMTVFGVLSIILLVIPTIFVGLFYLLLVLANLFEAYTGAALSRLNLRF